MWAYHIVRQEKLNQTSMSGFGISIIWLDVSWYDFIEGVFFFVNGQLKITIRWLYMLIFITFKTVHSLPAGFTAIFTGSCYMVTSIRIFARLTTFVLTIWSIETNATLCKENANILKNLKGVKLFNLLISHFVVKRFYFYGKWGIMIVGVQIDSKILAQK